MKHRRNYPKSNGIKQFLSLIFYTTSIHNTNMFCVLILLIISTIPSSANPPQDPVSSAEPSTYTDNNSNQLKRSLLSQRKRHLDGCTCEPGYYFKGVFKRCGLRPTHAADIPIYKKCVAKERVYTLPSGKCSAGCATCIWGAECLGGTYKDKACPIGYYKALLSMSCTQCSPGRYLAVPSSYQTSSTQIVCKACEKSFACPGGTTHQTCTAGKYTDSNEQTACKSCEPGYICNGQGFCTKIIYQEEDPANILGLGTAFWMRCGNGRTACPVGYYTNEIGLGKDQNDACKKCIVGSIAPTEGSSECVRCELGNYSNSYYKNGVYYSVCSKCLPGLYGRFMNGYNSCWKCPTDTWNNKTGSLSIDDCRNDCTTIGSYIPNDQRSCSLCGPGMYGSLIADTSKPVCKSCQKGTFITGASWSGYKWKLNPGQPISYQNEYGKTSCKQNCKAGSYILQDSSSADGHTYNIKCLPCIQGQFTNLNNQLLCSLCPNGQYQNQTNKTLCHNDCPQGSGIYDNGKGCVPCWKGKYSDKTTLHYCQKCPVGTWNNLTGQTKCREDCPVGYGVSADQLSCDICPINYFNDGIGGECKLW